MLSKNGRIPQLYSVNIHPLCQHFRFFLSIMKTNQLMAQILCLVDIFCKRKA